MSVTRLPPCHVTTATSHDRDATAATAATSHDRDATVATTAVPRNHCHATRLPYWHLGHWPWFVAVAYVELLYLFIIVEIFFFESY